MKKFVGLAAFGLVALFVAAPSPAAAGYLFRYNGWAPRVVVGWRGYGLYDWYSSPRFYGRAWRAGYYYPNSAWYYEPYTAYYPPDQAVEANGATIRMHVPSDARVSFEGEATSQSGADRTFMSPSLTPGRAYVYHIRVQWNENGKAVERNRDVTVHAGDRISLDMDQ
jgi:uncharacterized protein (TIGR03000 family)